VDTDMERSDREETFNDEEEIGMREEEMTISDEKDEAAMGEEEQSLLFACRESCDPAFRHCMRFSLRYGDVPSYRCVTRPYTATTEFVVRHAPAGTATATPSPSASAVA
jgi:predicted RNA polymerase sigma factor